MEIFYPSVSAIVELLHQQNALAIVAHPGMNAKEQMDRIHDLLQLGVDGFEVFSSYHSEQQTQFYYDLAKSHGLYMTCGSDFHGKTKPVVHIGMCSMEEEENTRLVRSWKHCAYEKKLRLCSQPQLFPWKCPDECRFFTYNAGRTKAFILS